MKKIRGRSYHIIIFLCTMCMLMNSGVVYGANIEPDKTEQNTAPAILLTEPQQSMAISQGDVVGKLAGLRSFESVNAGKTIFNLEVSEYGGSTDDVDSLPASLDWRTSGIVTAVRDQGACGSGWAFGTVGIMESAIKKSGEPMTDFSEQFLLSCNESGWNCDGGLTAHQYHYNTLGENQTEVGAVLESIKPYTATNGSCTVDYNHSYELSNWNFITGTEEDVPTIEQIKTAIYKYGPITARVCVGSAFQNYTDGVFSTNESCIHSTNHQIILVGWDDSTQSWILRNSWGTSWGEDGYMRIKYNTSRVGEGASWVIYTTGPIPTPVSPNSTITDTIPTYTWTKVSGATKYQYQLYKDSTLIYANTVSSDICETTGCTITSSDVLSAGNYQWRVCAYVDEVWRSASAFMNFTLNVPIPTSIFPSGTIADTTPTYVWIKASGATKYQYQLYKDSTLVYTKTVPSGVCETINCISTPSDVLSAGNYQWQVYAYVDSVWMSDGSYMNFTLPVTPTPISPGWVITDNTPTYTWSKVSGATKYRYQLYQDTTQVYADTVSASVCGSTDCSITPAAELNAGNYQWQVTAFVDGVWRSASAFKNFTLSEPVPSPVSPVGITNDATPTYIWTKVSGATKYQYKLYKSNTLVYTKTVSASACGTTNCTSTPLNVLNAGEYQWRVCAYVDRTWKSFSDFQSFTH